MTGHFVSAIAVASMTLAFVQDAGAADVTRSQIASGDVVTVDRPDLFRARESEVAPRFTTLLGVTVYGNGGKRVGEIEDFVLGKDGQAYAIIDTSEGPFDGVVELGNDEVVVAPLRELRNVTWDKGGVVRK